MKDSYKVEDPDASNHMLSVLQVKTREMNLKPAVWQEYPNEIPNGKLDIMFGKVAL